MKKNAVLLAALFLSLLCSCKSAETNISEDLQETVLNETENTVSTAVTITEISTETQTAAETKPAKTILPENAFLIDTLGYPDDGNKRYRQAYSILQNDLLCQAVSVNSGERYELYFYDLNEGSNVKAISLDTSFSNSEINGYIGFQQDDNALCRLCIYTNEYLAGTYTVVKEAVVGNDFSVCVNDVSYPFVYSIGSHKVYNKDGSLFDCDTDKLLVEGTLAVYTYEDGSKDVGKSLIFQDVAFPVDDDSFIYTSGGYEWTYGFGYYDYRTGENKFADLYDYYPLGIYDGKILSLESYEYFYLPKIYSTDMYTMKTEVYIDSFSEDFNIEFAAMSEDGDYIASIEYSPLVIIDTAKKELVKTYDISY